MPSASTVAELAVVINADTSGVEKGLADVGKQVSTFGTSMQSVFSGIGAGIGIKAFDMVVDGIKSATDVAVGFNSKMEQATIAFTSMLGSAEKAQAFLDDMKQFAATTPFEFPDLLDASKKMLAFGFAASDVRPLLTAVGSAAAAMGSGKTGVEAITGALGQMRAATVVQAGELNQLTEQGVPAFQILADAMGISTGEVKKLASEGKIASSVFIDAFQSWASANYGDMMAKQALTFEGAMSTIKDSLTFAVANAFKPFFELLSDAAVAIAAFVQSAEFVEWADGVASGLRELLPLLKTFATFLWDNRDAILAVGTALATFAILTTVIGWVTAIAAAIGTVTAAISASGGILAALGALVAILGGPVTLIIAAVALAVGALAYAWAENWGDIQGKTAAVVDFLSGVPAMISGFFDAIATTFDDLVTAVSDAWTTVKTTTQTVWDGIATFLSDWWRVILVTLTGPIGALAVFVIDHWTEIKTATETIFRAIANLLTAIWDEIYAQVIKPKVDAIKLYLSDTWEAIRAAIDEKMQAVSTLVATIWETVKTSTETVLNAVLTFVRDTIFEPMRAAVEEKINAARTAVETAITGLKTAAETALNPFLAWWRDTIWGPISAAVGEKMDAAKTAFEGVLNGFKTTVDTVMGGVKTAWETMWSAIERAASSPKEALETVKDAVQKLKDVMPEWLIPHSPTPFEMGIRGIADAVAKMQDRMKSFASGMGDVPGELADWIDAAIAATGASKAWASGLAWIAMHESSGKPHAVNPEAVGSEHASGIMQTLPSTFAAYAESGMKDIFNPVHNIAAAINYINAAYVKNGRSLDWIIEHWAQRGGYASGGWAGLHGPELAWLGERGPEYIVPNSALRGGGSAGAMQSVSMPIVIGGRTIEEIWIEGRDLAIRRGRVPGAGAASMGSLS